MEKPISDPTIPYVGPIQTRFTPGKMIRIEGTVPAVAYNFNINLQCGPQTIPQDDIAMQIAVRILDGNIGLNSLQNGIWGDEQRNLILPIKRAEKFEIILKCEFSQYKVSINSQHDYEFPQRIHYDRISHLAIDGDVSIIQICYNPDLFNKSEPVFGYGPEAPKAFPSANASFITAPPPPGIQAPSASIGFIQPPSYEATSPQPNKPPYPTSSPYPAASSYPTTSPPYPTGTAASMPYPTQQPIPYNAYPSAGAPGAVPLNAYVPPGMPPPGAPVPLNAPSSTVRPIKRSSTKRTVFMCCSVLLIVISVVVIILVKVVRKSHKSHSYTSSNYDSSNYGSSNYGSSNYGNNHYGNSNNHW